MRRLLSNPLCTMTVSENAAVVDCARIKAIADVKASGEFIARMNAEFLRLEQEAIQQQQLEEDDEECLMLLAA